MDNGIYYPFGIVINPINFKLMIEVKDLKKVLMKLKYLKEFQQLLIKEK
jgi:hypothetical protein